MIRLNIGCGKRNFGELWRHIDGGNYPHVETNDVFLNGYTQDSVDLIYSSHMLEYFSRDAGYVLLSKWHSVLKQNGVLKIGVPDFDAIVKLASEKEYEVEQFLGLLYGEMFMNEERVYHKTIYTFKSLCRILAKVGFARIERLKQICPAAFDDHSNAVLPHMSVDGIPVSLNIIAYKL